jgi:ribosomal protein S18 acetylase RimI-like enzyme
MIEIRKPTIAELGHFLWEMETAEIEQSNRVLFDSLVDYVDTDKLLVAIKHDSIVGAIVHYPQYDMHHIALLIVDPSSRRQKIGSTLLELVESIANTSCFVHPHTKEAHKFFIAKGYTSLSKVIALTNDSNTLAKYIQKTANSSL